MVTGTDDLWRLMAHPIIRLEILFASFFLVIENLLNFSYRCINFGKWKNFDHYLLTNSIILCRVTRNGWQGAWDGL